MVTRVNEGLMSSVPCLTVPEAVVASLYCSLGYRAVISSGRLHKGNVMFTAIPTHTQHNESHSAYACHSTMCTVYVRVCTHMHAH